MRSIDGWAMCGFDGSILSLWLEKKGKSKQNGERVERVPWIRAEREECASRGAFGTEMRDPLSNHSNGGRAGHS